METRLSAAARADVLAAIRAWERRQSDEAEGAMHPLNQEWTRLVAQQGVAASNGVADVLAFASTVIQDPRDRGSAVRAAKRLGMTIERYRRWYAAPGRGRPPQTLHARLCSVMRAHNITPTRMAAHLIALRLRPETRASLYSSHPDQRETVRLLADRLKKAERKGK